MSHNRLCWIRGLVAALFGIVGGAHAAVYDISADFSTASNPNGVWTYGYELFLGGPLIPYDVSENRADGIDLWHATTPYDSGAPVDANNPTGAQISILPAHTAFFHPGPNGEFSVFRFTTPNAGTYDISAIFAALDTGGTDVHVLLNGGSLYSHEVDPSNTPESYAAARTLTLGDIIDFAVGVGTDGDFFSDSTSINASLTSRPTNGVPEPASLTLLGTALVGLAYLRRRQRHR